MPRLSPAIINQAPIIGGIDEFEQATEAAVFHTINTPEVGGHACAKLALQDWPVDPDGKISAAEAERIFSQCLDATFRCMLFRPEDMNDRNNPCRGLPHVDIPPNIWDGIQRGMGLAVYGLVARWWILRKPLPPSWPTATVLKSPPGPLTPELRLRAVLFWLWQLETSLCATDLYVDGGMHMARRLGHGHPLPDRFAAVRLWLVRLLLHGEPRVRSAGGRPPGRRLLIANVLIGMATGQDGEDPDFETEKEGVQMQFRNAFNVNHDWEEEFQNATPPWDDDFLKMIDPLAKTIESAIPTLGDVP